MTNDELTRLVINVVVISWVSAAALNVIAASIYDLGQIRLKKKIARDPYNEAQRERPLISIIIPFSSSQKTLEACLQSIIKNRYGNYEIVLVDAGSRDNSNALIKTFLNDNSRKNIRRLPQSEKGYSAAVYAGAQAAGGQLIMVLPPRLRLDKKALKTAIQQLLMSKKAGSMGLNLKISPNRTFLGLLEQFEHLVRNQSHKLASLIRKRRDFENAVIYRRQALVDSAGKPNHQISYKYAANALVYNEPARSYISLLRRHSRYTRKTRGWLNGLLRVYLTAMRIVAPFLFVFIIYEAIYFGQTFLFALTWAALSVFLGLTALADEHLMIRQKLQLIVLAPAMYIPFFLSSFIAPLAAVKNILWALLRPIVIGMRRLPFPGRKEKVSLV
jgi:glycosyltransferase involved in cell wall biosynthesis